MNTAGGSKEHRRGQAEVAAGLQPQQGARERSQTELTHKRELTRPAHVKSCCRQACHHGLRRAVQTARGRAEVPLGGAAQPCHGALTSARQRMPAHTMSAASVATSTSTGLALPQSGARKPVRVLYGTASWPWPWPWPCPCSVAAGVGMYPVLNATACGPSLSWRTSSWPGGGPGSASATRPRRQPDSASGCGQVEWPGGARACVRRGFYRVSIDLLR